jgi:hypothetical protein
MADMEHRDIPGAELHVQIKDSFADESARLAATPVAADHCRFFLQLSDSSVWMWHSSAGWVPLTGTVGNTVDIAAGPFYVDGGDPLSTIYTLDPSAEANCMTTWGARVIGWEPASPSTCGTAELRFDAVCVSGAWTLVGTPSLVCGSIPDESIPSDFAVSVVASSAGLVDIKTKGAANDTVWRILFWRGPNVSLVTDGSVSGAGADSASAATDAGAGASAPVSGSGADTAGVVTDTGWSGVVAVSGSGGDTAAATTDAGAGASAPVSGSGADTAGVVTDTGTGTVPASGPLWQDTFDRANENPAVGWTGLNTGGAQISSNALLRTDWGNYRGVYSTAGGSLPADHKVTATVPHATRTAAYWGIALRVVVDGGATPLGATGIRFGSFDGIVCGNCQSYNNDNVSITVTGGLPASWTTDQDHTVAVEIIGTSVRIILDGQEYGTASISGKSWANNQTGTYVAIVGDPSGGWAASGIKDIKVEAI